MNTAVLPDGVHRHSNWDFEMASARVVSRKNGMEAFFPPEFKAAVLRPPMLWSIGGKDKRHKEFFGEGVMTWMPWK